MNEEPAEPFDWYELDDNRTPWLYGTIWLDSFDWGEIEDIKLNFSEFYDMVQDVEAQIFTLQIGLD